MRRKILSLILPVIYIFSTVCAANTEIYSPAATVICADSGIVLYEKNANDKMYPASTTKIVTAILAIESGGLEENKTLTASFNAVNSIDYDSSKICLSEGERMSFKDLLYALIIASANDAANVLAESICKKGEDFADLMNKKVKEIGCTNTHFTNAHGLHHEDHYTTASDLARIAAYAMKLPFFAEAVNTRSYTIAPTNKMKEKRELHSTNHLLDENSRYSYRYATGIKTGYTSKAGYCLVSSADKDGKKLICVTLGAKPSEDGITYSFIDSKKLLQYGYENHESVEVIKANDIISSLPINNAYADEVILSAETSVSVMLPKGASAEDITTKEYIKPTVNAPVNAGDPLGRMEYWYKDHKVGQCEMVAISSHSKIPLAFILKPVYKLFKSAAFYIVVALLIVVYMLYSSFVKKQKKIKRRKRRAAGKKHSLKKEV